LVYWPPIAIKFYLERIVLFVCEKDHISYAISYEPVRSFAPTIWVGMIGALKEETALMLTTTIGAYPKPENVPIRDWFQRDGGMPSRRQVMRKR